MFGGEIRATINTSWLVMCCCSCRHQLRPSSLSRADCTMASVWGHVHSIHTHMTYEFISPCLRRLLFTSCFCTNTNRNMLLHLVQIRRYAQIQYCLNKPHDTKHIQACELKGMLYIKKSENNNSTFSLKYCTANEEKRVILKAISDSKGTHAAGETKAE